MEAKSICLFQERLSCLGVATAAAPATVLSSSVSGAQNSSRAFSNGPWRLVPVEGQSCIKAAVWIELESLFLSGHSKFFTLTDRLPSANQLLEATTTLPLYQTSGFQRGRLRTDFTKKLTVAGKHTAASCSDTSTQSAVLREAKQMAMLYRLSGFKSHGLRVQKGHHENTAG